MQIIRYDKFQIITPFSPNLDKIQSIRIINEINSVNKKVSIDLSFVQNCSLDFIESIKNIAQNRDIGIFNIPSNIFILFNLMKIDKYAKLFVNEIDCLENSRQIINRNFSIL